MRADDRLGRGPGVGADMQVGGAQALPQAARVGVDLDRARAGIEVAALGRVVAERRADADHQVGFGEALAGEVAGKGAGDVERVGIAVEQALAEQRRREQRAGFARPAPPAPARRRSRMAPRPAMMIGFSASAIMSTTRSTIAGSGTGRCAVGSQIGRGRVVGDVRPGLLLQVHRHAQHHRAAARAAPPGRPRAHCRAGGRCA